MLSEGWVLRSISPISKASGPAALAPDAPSDALRLTVLAQERAVCEMDVILFAIRRLATHVTLGLHWTFVIHYLVVIAVVIV